MKHYSFVLIAAAFLFLSFTSGKPALNGTWKIVHEEIVRNGKSTFNIKNDKNSGLKTWSDNYFMFVSSEVNGLQVSGTYGGGTYELSGNNYIEHIQHHVAPNFRGMTLKMKLEVKGDTVVQIYPCDNSFYYDKNNCIIQKYVRLD